MSPRISISMRLRGRHRDDGAHRPILMRKDIMSGAFYLPFDTLLRNVVEHGTKVLAWCYLIFAGLVIVTAWSGLLYARLKRRRIHDLPFVLVATAALGLMAVGMFYGKVWLFMAVGVFEMVLLATVPKLRSALLRALQRAGSPSGSKAGQQH